MPSDAVVYVINLIIGLILALLLTQQWRHGSEAFNLRLWIVAAWVLASADLLFALRPVLPHAAGRFFPTVMVTVGHVVLLGAALRTAGFSPRERLLTGIGVAHAITLALFLVLDSTSNWRTVSNGLVWGGLSLASAVALWRSTMPVRQLVRVTAAVFLGQALFHAYRTLLALQLVRGSDGPSHEFVQLLGDLEVSLFIVALFVSVLVAYLRLGNLELRRALDDLKQLSGMLPLCAWCNNVRDDKGYWTKIEQYLQERRVMVTHSICESCQATHFATGEVPERP